MPVMTNLVLVVLLEDTPYACFAFALRDKVPSILCTAIVMRSGIISFPVK